MSIVPIASDQRPSGIREFSGALCDRPYLLDEYRDFILNHVTTMKVEKRLAAPRLRLQVQLRVAGGFSLVGTTITGGITSRLVRGESEIAHDGGDRFYVCMKMSGEGKLYQFGRSHDLQSGSYAMASESDPVTSESSSAVESRGFSFIMPASFVEQRLNAARAFCVHRSSQRTAMQDLASRTMLSFAQTAWRLSTGEFVSSARLVGELLLLALGGHTSVSTDENCARVANLARAKRIIRGRLAEPDLTPADVARQTGVSLRYLQKLFRADGQTIYEFVKGERLIKARRLLESKASGRRNVTEVFVECGFDDKSYFSRAFKQAFGVTPSDVLYSNER